MTILLNADLEADMAQAIHLLKEGKLVAVPTETVYGLAADARQPDAVQAIFAAKQRPENHPLIVHLGDVAQLEDWAVHIPSEARQLAESFWPGPLTLVLRKAPWVNPLITGGRDTVALRMPAHHALIKLLKQSGLALAAPSANPHKCLSPTSASHVLATMSGKLAAVLDGGQCSVGIESTILDMTSPEPRVLRSGPITANLLSAHLGRHICQPKNHPVAVPGNIAVHYRPNTPLLLKTAIQMDTDPGYPVVRLLLSGQPGLPGTQIHLTKIMPHDKEEYARRLYRTLYEVDQLAAKEIWVELPPLKDEWLDVHDRLKRACQQSVC
jgi:L-threonylcarbamoyladenylate synthase